MEYDEHVVGAIIYEGHIVVAHHTVQGGTCICAQWTAIMA